ncbi:MAG: restriction endonuclease subunit S, partial [Ruminococcus sp.]|nr:restriction endonuclease subunit S [Ruminococcus sp.]
IKSHIRKASIPRISRNVIEKIKIPVPPIEEQERIVNIFDKFDTLCNNLTKGIPAEIKAHKKQYEYYRDKLLTFKELK